MLGSCNSTILHGAYDQGSHVDFDLYQRSVDTGVQIIEIHNGLKAGDIDVGQCGRPISYTKSGGLVFNIWSIPHPIFQK